MWLWIVAGFAAFLLLILLGLCVPLDAVLDIDSAAEQKFRLRLIVLFGLTGFEVRPRFIKARGKRRRGRLSMPKLLRIVSTRGLLRSARHLLKDICSLISIEELALRVRIGMGEPAIAGIAYGLVSAIKPFLRLPAQYRMDLEPSFSLGPPECNAYCILRLRPIRFVIPIGRFILSRPGRRAIRIAFFDRG